MHASQLRVLYREFLFSVVDRDLLSVRGTGDASRLLLQLIALLIGVSICFCLAAAVVGAQPMAVSRLLAAWSIEHFLIATTMLVVGLLAVLSWDRLFPSQRDVLVLGPLPVHAHTILLAKLGAAATALTVAVLSLHSAAGLILPIALTRTSPNRAIHAPVFTGDRALPSVPLAELQEVLDRDLAPMLREGPLAPGGGGGIAIGVSQRGVRRVIGYGAAAPDSIFQIASVTKPFTGLLLAAMVERGLVRLDEPVRGLIPSAGLPPPDGAEITLLDLATHRSGLPGMPPGFRWSERPNPVADFDAARLYAFFHSRGMHRRPGASFVYSNIGFGLLGHALAVRAGTGYAALVREIVTEPLGLTDTVVTLSPEQQRRFLQGHDDRREPIPAWDYDALAGAGGLKSTAPDLLAWLEANLHPERVPPLSDALAASQRVRSTINSQLDIALAWGVDRTSGTFVHTGAILGFTADVSFDGAADRAVVVLSNVGPGTAWSAEAVGAHVRARLDGRPALSLAEVTVPPTGGVVTWTRTMAAYWITMFAAGLFAFGAVTTVQGLAAAVLPFRVFTRLSSPLQLAMFALMVATYVLQPTAARPVALVEAQGAGWLAWSPTFWFLGLFQQLGGSPALAPLAHTAWTGLTAVAGLTAAAYGLSYARTLRHLAESPDPSSRRARAWLPAFGSGPRTAIVSFAVSTALRSAQHRVILAFYWGLGFALVVAVLKVPRGGQGIAAGPAVAAWDDTAVALILASVVTIAFAVLAARLACSMPRDPPANWIFRVIPFRPGAEYVSARRWATIVLSVVPVWTGWVGVFLALWPWQPAVVHLVALLLLGCVFVELALTGPLKIPCTCTYLPGKSQVHLVFCVAGLLLVGMTLRAARLELEVLGDSVRSAVMVGGLALVWVALRVVNRHTQAEEPIFDDGEDGEAVTLGVWDSRLASPPGPSVVDRGQGSQE